MERTPKGLCECGCGQRTKIAAKTNNAEGYKKGEPRKFVNGHGNTGKRGNKTNGWKGGKMVNSDGYVLIHRPTHPKSSSGYIREHILIAESALGKPLPPGVKVHHVNGIEGDNSRGNHVICQDNAYHFLIHQRTRAYQSCGHANWLKCCFCKKYDNPNNLFGRRNRAYHPQCQLDYNRQYKRQKALRTITYKGKED